MQIEKTFVWKKKEIDFLTRNYSTTDNKILSRRLKADRQTVIRKANSLNLRKIYFISCRACQKSIIVKSHMITRCKKCQIEYTKKMTRLRIANIRKTNPKQLKENYDRWKLKALDRLKD